MGNHLVTKTKTSIFALNGKKTDFKTESFQRQEKTTISKWHVRFKNAERNSFFVQFHNGSRANLFDFQTWLCRCSGHSCNSNFMIFAHAKCPFLKRVRKFDEILPLVQSLCTQTWLKQLTTALTWPVNNFSRISEEIQFRMHFFHEFPLILEFNTAFLLQIRFESHRLWPFVFQKFDWNFKTQSTVSVQVVLSFWHNAASFTRIGSKIRKKILSSWRKNPKSNCPPSQSTNHSKHVHRQ